MERIEQLKAFLAATPEDPFLQHALALEYVKIGEDGMARKTFEKLLAVNPGYVGSYYHLAKLLERIGEPGLAIGCYQRGMETASEAGDRHALNELRAAHDELAY